jgi:hypothetical protein
MIEISVDLHLHGDRDARHTKKKHDKINCHAFQYLLHN